MASQCTHIILANKVYSQYFKTKDRKKFFIGTCFPDIRYLGFIQRDKTHFKEVKIQEVAKENSFQAGLKFHSLVDKVMGDYYVKSKDVYSLIPKSKFVTQAIKFLVDRILYGEIKDWEEYVRFFDEVLPEELDYELSEEQIKKWHQALQSQFKTASNDAFIRKMTGETILTNESFHEIKSIIDKLSGDKRIIEMTREFYNQFPNLIKD